MKQGTLEIISNRSVARDTFELRLRGDTQGVRPGQFAEIAVPGFFLRRPFSICDAESGVLTLVYHVSGAGTAALSRMGSGELEVMYGLGNGFDMTSAGERPLLIAGGTGLTPIYFLAKTLKAAGISPLVIAGFASYEDVFYCDRLAQGRVDTVVLTADGSAGRKGLVTDAMDDEAYSAVYACGPLPMLKALQEKCTAPAQFSLEARMGCGFGACMGCTIETKNGGRRVCKDGPVFKAEDLIW